MMGKMTFLTVGDPMGGIISHSNNEPYEVSRLHSSEEVSVMGMERRTEQLISWSKSQLRVFDNTHAERGTTSTMWLKLTKGKGNNAWRNKEYL